ncbi:MAG: sigma 54-interacting transcriptional regulator [Nitrospirae bacterium]|nr:sigma 54-interacting transcriptional regulator [Nitrospirota bacterium]
MKSKILVIDDEESIRFTFENFLSDEGYDADTAEDFGRAIAKLDEKDFDIIFVDILLGDKTGIDILREVKNRNLNCSVIMMTGYPNIETVSDALRLGAFDYITKPISQQTLLHTTRIALKHRAMTEEKDKYHSNLEAIFRSVKDAIITMDKELVVVEVNDAAGDICGFSRDIVGKKFESLATWCGRRCLESLTETIAKKEMVEVHRFECRNHQGQVVSLTASPLLDSYGNLSGAVLVIRDESRLAGLERNLGERKQFHNMVGKSEKIQKIYSLIEDLADVQTTVLITGESGTGKELVADALHYRGSRGNKPLVKVNCSALSENLLESELFGHVRGAFTGAIQDKVGRFQRADGGTIFLDEIGDISPLIQLKLLRVIQEKEFERVGDSIPLKVDVMIIAATNQNLSEKVKRGEFREDLYYRLKVVEITMPPLRERRDDMPLLVDYLLEKFNKRFNKTITAISDDVQRIFMNYNWPGNIRELEHTLEHACILCRQNTIILDHLPPEVKEFTLTGRSSFRTKKETEHQEIIAALKKTAWNKARAARLLGIDRKTIYRKIEEYKIAACHIFLSVIPTCSESFLEEGCWTSQHDR